MLGKDDLSLSGLPPWPKTCFKISNILVHGWAHNCSSYLGCQCQCHVLVLMLQIKNVQAEVESLTQFLSWCSYYVLGIWDWLIVTSFGSRVAEEPSQVCSHSWPHDSLYGWMVLDGTSFQAVWELSSFWVIFKRAFIFVIAIEVQPFVDKMENYIWQL